MTRAGSPHGGVWSEQGFGGVGRGLHSDPGSARPQGPRREGEGRLSHWGWVVGGGGEEKEPVFVEDENLAF